MANGTIAFDTLTTSGQIDGTARSIDTDYLLMGTNKAWVNHDQATVHDSFNVGSVTDNGTGDYGTNFTNNMANANYSAGGIGVHDGGSYTRIQTYDHDDPFTTAQGTINMQDTNGTQGDAEPACTNFVGELA
tara:strand:+ start:283 stop:678 length:396 start_codon:yes stop_codon:yes gene_type:complete